MNRYWGISSVQIVGFWQSLSIKSACLSSELALEWECHLWAEKKAWLPELGISEPEDSGAQEVWRPVPVIRSPKRVEELMFVMWWMYDLQRKSSWDKSLLWHYITTQTLQNPPVISSCNMNHHTLPLSLTIYLTFPWPEMNDLFLFTFS